MTDFNLTDHLTTQSRSLIRAIESLATTESSGSLRASAVAAAPSGGQAAAVKKFVRYYRKGDGDE
jgi:hypothetical protein